jgi:mRNA (guanine-N7-)-methyltransferase
MDGPVNVVADHYNRMEDKGLQARNQSAIYYLRNFNNWIKSVLLSKVMRKGDFVLDMSCGKGGDFRKFQISAVRYVVAADVAEVSVTDAVNRYNSMAADRRHPASFALLPIVADCWQTRLAPLYPAGVAFHLCSCQFALHYAFETEEKARMALRNASDNLLPGGHFVGTIPNAVRIVKRVRELPPGATSFGNDVYRVDEWSWNPAAEPPAFGARYCFTLTDAVSRCPEYLVHFSVLQRLAAECDMELKYRIAFHEFYRDHIKVPEHLQLFQRMDCLDRNGSIPADQWEALGIYEVFIFRKKKVEGPPPAPSYRPPAPGRFPPEQIIRTSTPAAPRAALSSSGEDAGGRKRERPEG